MEKDSNKPLENFKFETVLGRWLETSALQEPEYLFAPKPDGHFKFIKTFDTPHGPAGLVKVSPVFFNSFAHYEATLSCARELGKIYGLKLCLCQLSELDFDQSDIFFEIPIAFDLDEEKVFEEITFASIDSHLNKLCLKLRNRLCRKIKKPINIANISEFATYHVLRGINNAWNLFSVLNDYGDRWPLVNELDKSTLKIKPDKKEK